MEDMKEAGKASNAGIWVPVGTATTNREHLQNGSNMENVNDATSHSNLLYTGGSGHERDKN